LPSQARSAREDSAEKPRSACSLVVCAARSRAARDNITRVLAAFIGSTRILARKSDGALRAGRLAERTIRFRRCSLLYFPPTGKVTKPCLLRNAFFPRFAL